MLKNPKFNALPPSRLRTYEHFHLFTFLILEDAQNSRRGETIKSTSHVFSQLVTGEESFFFRTPQDLDSNGIH